MAVDLVSYPLATLAAVSDADSSQAAVEIEVLWWRGCPSTEKALAELDRLIGELGPSDFALTKTEIEDEQVALEREFVGSPTILVDGLDVHPPTDTDSIGLNCRIYYRRDGRVSPLPDSEDLRDALIAAQDERRKR